MFLPAPINSPAALLLLIMQRPNDSVEKSLMAEVVRFLWLIASSGKKSAAINNRVESVANVEPH